MSKLKEESITFRVAPDYKKRIDAYVQTERGLTRTAFIKRCIDDHFRRQTEDSNMLLENLHVVRKEVGSSKTMVRYVIELLLNFVMNYFAHTPEIPKEIKPAALKEGRARLEKFLTNVDNNPLISRVLMMLVNEVTRDGD